VLSRNARAVLLPASSRGQRIDLAQNGEYIDSFPKVAAGIFSETLHPKHLAETRRVRKPALTNGSRPVRGTGLLVAKAVLVPARIEAQILEHLQVLLDRLIKRCQIVANHQRACSCGKYHALETAQIDRPPAGDHNFLAGQNKPEAGD